MRARRMGSGLELPVIGLGCMVMPGFYGPAGEAESTATLHRAAEIGVPTWIPPTPMAPVGTRN